MRYLVKEFPISKKVNDYSDLLLRRLSENGSMCDVSVIIPISKNIENSDLLKLSALLDTNLGSNYCLSIAADSDALTYLRILEKKHSKTLKIFSSEEQLNYSQLVRFGVNHSIESNLCKFFVIMDLNEIICSEKLSQEVNLLRSNKKLALRFFKKRGDFVRVKNLSEKIINIYAKYYLSLNIKGFSIKNCVMNRGMASQLYKKPFSPYAFYDFSFLNRFSHYIHGQLD